MVTTNTRPPLNVQRLIAETQLDLPSKKDRGYEDPKGSTRTILTAPVKGTRAEAKPTTAQLPGSYKAEPKATPTAAPAPIAAAAKTMAQPTSKPTHRTSTNQNPVDYDPTMTIDQAKAYVYAKTDAAGVPREFVDARLQYEIDVARNAGASVNPDGSVNIPSDADIVAESMGAFADGFIGTFQEINNPSPRQSYDGVPITIKETYIKAEDRVDSPRNAPYPGPFNPKMSLDDAIQYVFKLSDAQLIGTPNGNGHIPRSYTADYLDNFIKQQKAQGVPEAAIVASMAGVMGMVVSGYNFEAYREYYKANPEAEREHNRMMAENSAQTQVLAAQMS